VIFSGGPVSRDESTATPLAPGDRGGHWTWARAAGEKKLPLDGMVRKRRRQTGRAVVEHHLAGGGHDYSTWHSAVWALCAMGAAGAPRRHSTKGATGSGFDIPAFHAHRGR